MTIVVRVWIMLCLVTLSRTSKTLAFFFSFSFLSPICIFFWLLILSVGPVSVTLLGAVHPLHEEQRLSAIVSNYIVIFCFVPRFCIVEKYGDSVDHRVPCRLFGFDAGDGGALLCRWR
jgi:hypothetical protein